MNIQTQPTEQGCDGCGIATNRLVISGGGPAWDGHHICASCEAHNTPDFFALRTTRRRSAVRRSVT